jgi:hypothetical protein
VGALTSHNPPRPFAGISFFLLLIISYSTEGNKRSCCKKKKSVEFEVLTVVVIESIVMWDVTLCSRIEVTDVSEERIAPIFRVKE